MVALGCAGMNSSNSPLMAAVGGVGNSEQSKATPHAPLKFAHVLITIVITATKMTLVVMASTEKLP